MNSGLDNSVKQKAGTFFKQAKSLILKGLQKFFVVGIIFYQKGISPFIGPRCRYIPTCSEYCKEALLRYGPFKGSLMGLKRICRCHPFHEGGYDPVP